MSKEKNLPKEPCNNSGHKEHMCSLTSEFFHVNKADQFREMVKEPDFKCQFCGRVSKKEKHLCYPTEI